MVIRMKNKFGLIGFVALLGIWGIYTDEPMFLPFFAFILFFEYLFVIPDELFVQNIRKAAGWAFFGNLIITISATLIFSAFNMSSNPLAGGSALGFGFGISIFCFSTSFLEWREKWRNRHEN